MGRLDHVVAPFASFSRRYGVLEGLFSGATTTGATRHWATNSLITLLKDSSAVDEEDGVAVVKLARVINDRVVFDDQ